MSVSKFDASVQTAGTIHACFGPASDRNVLNFYGEGELGTKAFHGLGECLIKRNYPEGDLVFLRGLPEPYIGGALTTNSITSPKSLIGEKTEPPGYAQNSIATRFGCGDAGLTKTARMHMLARQFLT